MNRLSLRPTDRNTPPSSQIPELEGNLAHGIELEANSVVDQSKRERPLILNDNQANRLTPRSIQFDEEGTGSQNLVEHGQNENPFSDTKYPLDEPHIEYSQLGLEQGDRRKSHSIPEVTTVEAPVLASQDAASTRAGFAQRTINRKSTSKGLRRAISRLGRSMVTSPRSMQSPIANAASTGNTRLVSQLLSENPSLINALVTSSSIHDRPRAVLMRAAAGGHVQCVSELLHQGIDWNVRDEDGKTAFMVAIESQQPNSVAALLARFPASKLEIEGLSLLRCAAIANNAEACTMLLARGAKGVDAQDYHGLTLLH